MLRGILLAMSMCDKYLIAVDVIITNLGLTFRSTGETLLTCTVILTNGRVLETTQIMHENDNKNTEVQVTGAVLLP